MMRDDPDKGGVRDAFAPPDRQPYRVSPAPIAKSLPPAAPDDGDVARAQTTLGSLAIVDTGVMAVNQMTVEGRHWIAQADRVLFLGSDPVIERFILSLNGNVESLNGLGTSDEIVERALDPVRAGLAVCVAVHGSSALNAEVSRAAIKQGRAGGFSATIVPGVSTLDCLFADLGLDLVQSGCQIFGAKAFLARRQRPERSVGLILSLDEEAAPGGLLEALRSAYGVDHKAVLYEPARYAVLEPVIRHCSIEDIGEADLAEVSIVYVPAKDAGGRASADQRLRKRTK